MDNVLINELENEDIQKYLRGILKVKNEVAEKDAVIKKVLIRPMQDNVNPKIGVKFIKSISQIKNVGLLNIEQPISLNKGLNVFFGKNGSGKSSVFLALCKSLGFEKNIYANLNSETNDSVCSIIIEDKDGFEKGLDWKTGEINHETDVKFFDTQISQYLVEKDQVNQFEISHLKSESFSLIHQLLDVVESNLESIVENTVSKKNELKKCIDINLPTFFTSEETMTKKDIIQTVFTQGEEKKLKELVAKKTILEKDNIGAIIKNLKTAQSLIEKFLDQFSIIVSVEDEKTKKIVEQVQLKFTKKYFSDINDLICQYNSAKETFEESGSQKLEKIIPTNWIKIEKWNEFIKTSIEFIKILEEEERRKFTEQNCIYCHQPLLSDSAKKLILIYHQIQEEYEKRLKEILSELEDISNELSIVTLFIDDLADYNLTIESEFPSIGKTDKLLFDKSRFKLIFNNTKSFINIYKTVQINDSDVELINKYWKYYFNLYNEFKNFIISLSSSVESKEKKLDIIKTSTFPLQFKNGVVKNNETLIKYFECVELENNINTKLSDISALRQFVSRLATKFSEEIPLEIFKSNLIKEYEKFNFILPDVWNLSTITRGKENKRVYSLKDNKLAEIFSEGERKIHALADFFSICKTNDFKGVYIFDDPVNSLDEDNIESVRDRLLSLVMDENQVIVFTHNLFFLYSLIEHNYDKEKITKLTRLSNSIYLEKEIKIGSNNELKKIYTEIESRMTDLSQMDEQKIEEYKIREVYNLISGYLETYVEVNIFKEVISRYRPNIRMNGLNRITDKELELVEDLLTLYNQSSRKGSRHSHPIPTPIPKYSELRIDYIKMKEKYSYS